MDVSEGLQAVYREDFHGSQIAISGVHSSGLERDVDCIFGTSWLNLNVGINLFQLFDCFLEFSFEHLKAPHIITRDARGAFTDNRYTATGAFSSGNRIGNGKFCGSYITEKAVCFIG